jgi:hypothetical protein
VLLVSLAASACSNLPKEPEGNFYHLDFPRAQALCSSSSGQQCKKLLISECDKFYMFSPKYWEAIQNYIDLLKCQVGGGCKSMSISQISTTTINEDLNKIKLRMTKIKKNLDIQRNYFEKGKL